MKLISHVNADSDIIEAWLRYYQGLGVTQFHLVLHGEGNEFLRSLVGQYPIIIEDEYQGGFDETEKKRRLDAVLSRHSCEWVLLVDSDEFVELPYDDLGATIFALEQEQATALTAPMLQHMKPDGTFETHAPIANPFVALPTCSVHLYASMGLVMQTSKFPLFYNQPGTQMVEGGNHFPPAGTRVGSAFAVTHHFKFRSTLHKRLESRINSSHQWRHDSISMAAYLALHLNYLPLRDAFRYSRHELFRRGLLRRTQALNFIRHAQNLLEEASKYAPASDLLTVALTNPAFGRKLRALAECLPALPADLQGEIQHFMYGQEPKQ